MRYDPLHDRENWAPDQEPIVFGHVGRATGISIINQIDLIELPYVP